MVPAQFHYKHTIDDEKDYDDNEYYSADYCEKMTNSTAMLFHNV